MPQIIVAAAASAAGGAVAGALGLTIGSIAYGVVSGLTAAVVGTALGSALGLNKPPKANKFTAAAQDRQQMIRSAVATRQVVYGLAMMSGPIVFAASTGSENQYLHVVVPLAHGESQEIVSVQFGDDTVGTLDGAGNVTSGRFSGKMRIKKHLGASSQTADSDLVAEVAEWTTDHRLQGITYLYVRLQYDTSVYPYGLENIKAKVKGRKVYDPRSLTTAWTDNWALCLADYLMADYGLRATSAEVDMTGHLITQANLCDESVSIPGGGTQARYTCNGAVDLGNTIAANLRGLLTGAVGNLVYTQGQYRLYAAAYDTPTITLDENDLRGDMSLQARPSRQSLFNGVRGTFVSPDNFWQPSDFPQVTNATYESQDGGEQLLKDIELPYTIDGFAAQRMAKIILERGRQGITATLPCKLTAFRLAAWDNFSLTIDHLGWSAKTFRVTRWVMQPTGGVDLEIQEEASASYSWSSSDATVVDAAPDTTLPSLLNVAPPTGLILDSGGDQSYQDTDGALNIRILVQWTASAGPFVDHYEVAWKPVAESVFQAMRLDAAATSVMLSGLRNRTSYDVRVRAVNIAGRASEWASDTLTASYTALADVAGLAVEGPFTVDGARIKWSRVEGAIGYDVRVYTSSTLRREVQQVANTFSYSYQDAIADGGLARSLHFEVRAYDGGDTSDNWTTLDITNPQIAAPDNVAASAGYGNVLISADRPGAADYSGTLIWAGDATGFTCDASSLIYDGPNTVFTHTVAPGAVKWFRMAHYDVFGQDSLNYSGYFSSTALNVGGVPTTATTPGSTYLGEDVVYCTADGSLYEWTGAAYERATPVVNASQINAANLAAISANLGSITAGDININNKFIVASDGIVTMQSATTGARKVETSTYIKVYDAAGVKRLQLGDLSA